MGVPVQGQGDIHVILESDLAAVPAAAAAAKAAGATVDGTYQNLIEATLPLSALAKLSQTPSIRLIRQPLKPIPLDVSSQGVNLISANVWQAAGLTGAGVKVGVLDLEFGNLAAAISAGELPAIPAGNTWWSPSYGQGAGAHGTACAEIVHDIAPNAQLYLATAYSEVELSQAVNWMISQGVNIISHSIGWYPSPGDGTGTVDSIVDTARAAGILWVSAAGNDAERHWAGGWATSDTDPTKPEWLDFSPGVHWAAVTANAGDAIEAYLRWTDPWGNSTNDYDLYLYKASNLTQYVDLSNNAQTGPGCNPEEDLTYKVPYGQGGTYYLMVQKFPGASTSESFDLFTPSSPTLSPYQPVYSIGTPADSPNALAVGAVYWDAPTSIEYFSSQGPTRDGRTKPDLAGPDGVSTFDWPSPFYGSSAAAPHVAGAAALVKQARPGYGPAEIQSFLENRAIDLGTPGKDNAFGSGMLQLNPMADFHAASTRVSASNAAIFFDDSIGGPTSWSWSFGDGGTSTLQNPSHTYTRAGDYTVSLTAINAGGATTMTKNSYIKVTASSLDHIVVSPSAPEVPAGTNQSFSATGYDAEGNPISGLTFTWNVVDQSVGTIDPGTGIFTAKGALGWHNNVIVVACGLVAGFGSVIIVPGPVAYISIAPQDALVPINGVQAFTAQAYDAFSNPIPGLTYRWALTRSAAGSIDAATGVFTASTTAGVFRAVQATCAGVSAIATVTITPGALETIRVVPWHPKVIANTQQAFSAIGYDHYGNPIPGLSFAWSLGLNAPSAGSINSSGVYTGASAPGDYIDLIKATVGAITGTASAEVLASGAVLNGTITLQGSGRPASARAVPLTVKLFAPGTDVLNGAPVVTYTPVMTEDAGSNTVIFQIDVSAIPAGPYDITVAGPYTLVNVKRNVTLTAGINSADFGTLLEGDSKSDGQVNILDFSILAGAYMKSLGQAGYNASADFDGNGIVNTADFSLLAANYLRTSPVAVP